MHELNLTLDSRTGQVFGDLAAPEPQTISCQVTAKASGLASGPHSVAAADATASLQIRVEHFAYGASALTFTSPNQSFAASFQGSFKNFQLRCTPNLPWAQIDGAGSISMRSGTATTPRTASCTAP